MKPLAPKTKLQNRYLISRIIGKGGMGEVYLATDTRLGNNVALKRTTVGDDEMLAAAFEREARTLAGLRHPALPKVSDHFLEDDEQFLIMDFIGGEDLSQRLKDTNKPFPLNWVLFWADQLLDALAYLHTHVPPIIHRDIKPQNLKLTGENQIVLLDFGLSKNALGQTKVTTSGSVVGYTPHYAPMEQIRGTGTNARSDLYALSATLYHLLANSVPPDALTRADAMLANLPDPIRPLPQLNGEVPQAVSDAIIKGMDMSQDRRYDDARMMQKALRRAYNRMQESMAAETVAFGLQAEIPPIETPEAAESSHDAKTEVGINLADAEVSGMVENISSPSIDELPEAGDISGEKTEVFNAAEIPSLEKTEVLPPPVTASEDLDATVQVGAVIPGIIDEEQNVVSEIGNTPQELPLDTADDAFDTNDDIAVSDDGFVTDFGSESTSQGASEFTPDGTQDFSGGEFAVGTDEEDLESDSDFNEEELETAAPGAAFVGESDEPAAPVSVATAAAAKGSKSSIGKYIGILAGIGLVLLVVVGAVGGGLWYFTAGPGGTSSVQPENTPITAVSPTPLEEDPTPEVTPEETPDENGVNTDPGNVDLGSNTDLNPVVNPTPVVKSTPRKTPVRSKPSTPKPRVTPKIVKPTPKKAKTPKNAGVL